VALRLTVGLLVVLVSGSLAERGRTRRALEDSERRNRTILETAGDAFIGIDLHGRITDWNRRAEEAFGWRRDEVLGMPLADTIIPARMRQAHAEGLRRYRETGEGTLLRRPVEMRAMHRNGREFPVEISVWSITEQGHPGFIAFVRDISERKQHEDQIAYLAYHDRLTGLGNRAMLEEHLEKALARSRRHARAVAVLCVDLDNLRLVNDGLGNEAGDELLRQAGERLQEAARETDLVTRQGGDEFLILLADLFPGPGDSSRAAARTAESVVERIHAAFRAPFRLAGTELYMSASIGVSLFPLDAADARTLLANASAAMHRSKQAGPGGHAMYAGGSADPVGKLSLSTRLRRAVEQEQWSLQFQPIVELDTNTVVAAEALLRWDEPGREPTPPSRFIALAEELGLIEAIGDWVLHALCRQAREWGDDGLDLAVTFNLSPRQLWKAGVAERIMSAVRAEGADPGQIVVEITESAAMTDPARTQVALQSLRDRGLRLAIDDFGTGYSSLSRLKHLAVDLLKIDLSFMADIPHDEGAARLMTAIIHLAKSLDVVPLAEGIQTSDQWEFLVERGCVLGQGFQFGPAVPAAELAARCRRSSIRVVHEHSAS
jgi:diguanylate cyclase (GGDEF)-like protein/PAS domain S-box-containing protein